MMMCSVETDHWEDTVYETDLFSSYWKRYFFIHTFLKCRLSIPDFLNWFNNMTILTLYLFFHSLLSSKKIIIFHLLNLRQRNYKKSVSKIWISTYVQRKKGFITKAAKIQAYCIRYQNCILSKLDQNKLKCFRFCSVKVLL